MTRRRGRDEPDDFDGDDEYGSDDWAADDPDDFPDGVYHDEELPTVPCPYCRREISEDAPRCPYCENYVSREDAPAPRRSRFWIAMMILALLAAAWWVI
ncbi:hypothetical protein [Fimbriiglobus ruber]|uniref:Zinc-ribbon domain-containing protein n=1 Tax=Fimbriiglobus ruber TaxID=1908690 RepID=A0A225DAE7_9BACT|nr:hypothetical protein [Fimbriiglobus ruber]OWK38531.1 hypothetical protein FRUB_07651 [Fimbriiglobus ruber]